MLTSRVITTDDHQGLLTAPGMTYIIALPINEISLDSVSLPQCLFDFSIAYQDCGAMGRAWIFQTKGTGTVFNSQ